MVHAVPQTPKKLDVGVRRLDAVVAANDAVGVIHEHDLSVQAAGSSAV